MSLCAGAAHAQITADTASSGSTGGVANTLTFAHTVGAGNDRLLVVGVSLRTDNGSANVRVASMTYGGVAMTCLFARTDANSANTCGITGGGGTFMRSEIWTLANPASGAANVIITLNGTQTDTIAAGAQSYARVASVAAAGTAGNAGNVTTASVSGIAVPTGGFVFDNLAIAKTSTALTATGTGHTLVADLSDTSNSGLITHIQDGTGQVTGQTTATASWTWTTSSPFAQVTGVLTPVVAPTISKAFAPTSITVNGTSTLTLTFSNSNAVALTGVGVVDNLPAGVQVAGTPAASNTCGATFNPAAAATTLTVSGGTVPASGNCTAQVNVTSAAAGTYNNTTNAVTSTNGGTGGTSNTATLTVTIPPTIAKAFGAGTIALNTSTSLTLTITNPSATVTQTGLAVTDTFPAGLVVATPSGASDNGCGGTFTANAGAGSVSLSGGSLGPSGSCTLVVNVAGITAGSKTNTTGAVSSTNQGNGNTASAGIVVVAPPTITKAFGSGAAGIPVNGTSTMTITITNPAANTVALTGVTLGDTFPAGMTVSTALTTTCSGGLTGGGVSAGSFSLNASTVNTGSNCTITGSVTDNTAGVATNTTGAVSSTNGGGTNTATANLPVNNPPTVTKAFAPTNVATGASSQLTITISDPDTVTLTGVSISDTFPAGLVVQTPPGSSVAGCFTGTLTANAGAGSISLTGASVAVGTPCVIHVNVTSATVGTYNNATAAPTSTNGGTGVASNIATLTVTAPPTITKSFTPPSIASGGTSTLTLTVTNPATNTGAMNGIAVSDTFPGSMVVTATPTVTNTCGGTFTANANANNISLTGGSIASAPGSCSVSVTVTSTTGGNNSNTTGTVSSSNDGTGGTANAVLNVVLPPTITKVFGSSATGIAVNTGSSTMTITITNPAANTVALNGVTVTDTFPGGMTVSTALITTCSGGLGGTGSVGSNTFTLSASNINTGSSCTITGSVKDITAGVATNTTGAVTSTNGDGTNTATANLPVNNPPTVTKAFSPTSVAMNVSSQMTITITNPNTVALTGVTISDTFPAGLVVQTPNGAGTSGCTGGTLTATAGSSSVSLSASSVAVGTPCVIQVNVTSAAVGTYNNTTNPPNSTNGGTGVASNTATLIVTAAPSITKSFNPTSIPLNGTSTLTLAITNPATNIGAMNGIAVSDTFPGGMTVASTPALNNTCGGSVAGATSGSGTISLTNGTIGTPGQSCTVSVNVTSTTAGARNNTTGAVSSTNDGTGGTASATLDVFGVATKLVYTQQPSNTAAGSMITPAITVAVEDANSLVVTNSSASVAIAITTNPGGGTLSGTTPVNAVNGVATFSDLSINRVGNGYRLTATSTGLTSAQSNTFNITVGTATQLVFTTQPDGAATGGVAFPTQPTVTVEDADGNTITTGTESTASITLAIGTNPSGGTLTCTTNPKAAVAGVDTFAGCKINFAGNGYTLTASATGLATATSNPFNIAVGPATQLAFGVQPTNTQFSTAITPPVTVLVEDAGGDIVNSSASVTMSIGTNPSGGTLSGTLTVPAVSGTATFSNLLINKPGLGYTLHAAATGLTAVNSSAFNILAGTATQLVFGVQPSNTMAGAPITPAVTVQVEDAGGNVVLSGTGSNASVSIVIGSNPSAGVLGGTTTVTASAGVATFSTLTISALGNGYTLVANSTGPVLTSATSNLFNITAPQVTYIQPFNSGHGWTYTQMTCSVGVIGICSNSAAATGANCAATPCVDAAAFAGLQTGASQTGYFHSPIGSYTWASLGIPANSTVVSVQGAWNDLAGGVLSSCTTGTTAGIQIFDSGNTTEITNSDVAMLVQVAGDTTTALGTHTLGPAVNVLNGFQATSTGITLRFNLNQDTAGFLGTCTLYGDTFELLIDYTVGSPANGRRGQVVIAWNWQPDGTIGEAWAYNVELTSDSASRLTLANLKLVPNGRSGFVLDPSVLEGDGRRVIKQESE